MPFASAVMALFPAPPRSAQATPTAPTMDTASISAGLTNEAKQVMISSLQLDITERARRLRQQYNEQAQQLRTRLERRLNRLPQKLRTKTMGELVEDHARSTAENAKQQEKATRPLKRTSTHAFGVGSDDKENQTQSSAEGARGQKKRTKLTKPQTIPLGTKTTDIQSRSHANILSPRSHNSRTLPRSPVKFQSPAKPLPTSNLARPRAAPKATTTTRAPSRAVSRQGIAAGGRKPAPKSNAESESEGRESESSATSAVTTIVKKPATATKRAPAAKKAPAKPATTATKKRAPAATKKKAEPSAPTTRTLRSRA